MFSYFKKRTSLAFYLILWLSVTCVWYTDDINNDTCLKIQNKCRVSKKKVEFFITMIKQRKNDTNSISKYINVKEVLKFCLAIKKIKIMTENRKGCSKTKTLAILSEKTLNNINLQNELFKKNKKISHESIVEKIVYVFVNARNQNANPDNIKFQILQKPLQTLKHQIALNFINTTLEFLCTDYDTVKIVCYTLKKCQNNLKMFKKLNLSKNKDIQKIEIMHIIDIIQLICATFYELRVTFIEENRKYDQNLPQTKINHIIYNCFRRNAQEYNAALYEILNLNLIQDTSEHFASYVTAIEDYPKKVNGVVKNCSILITSLETINSQVSRLMMKIYEINKTDDDTSENLRPKDRYRISKSLFLIISENFDESFYKLRNLNCKKSVLNSFLANADEINKLNSAYSEEIYALENNPDSIIILKVIFKILDLHYYNFIMLEGFYKFNFGLYLKIFKNT